MSFPKISVCMIVKNAESTLEECLESLRCFDEIILLDNKSTDSTLQIAQEFNKTYQNLKVFESEFIGFGALKNLALSKAGNDWVFSIDADEVLDRAVLKELESLQWSENLILAMPRKNLYRGEWIKACGWYPDFVNRIFNKTHTQFNANLVHESLDIKKDTQITRLKNGLLHYAYYDMETLLAKIQHYSMLFFIKKAQCLRRFYTAALSLCGIIFSKKDSIMVIKALSLVFVMGLERFLNTQNSMNYKMQVQKV